MLQRPSSRLSYFLCLVSPYPILRNLHSHNFVWLLLVACTILLCNHIHTECCKICGKSLTDVRLGIFPRVHRTLFRMPCNFKRLLIPRREPLVFDVMLWPTVSRLDCLGVKYKSGAYDQSLIVTDGQSRSKSWCRAPSEADGSVFSICCWPSPALSLSGPSSFGQVTIFYCLRLAYDQSRSHIATDGQSESLGVEPHVRLVTRYLLLLTVTVSFLWGALSNERTGLPFVYAAGSLSAQHFSGPSPLGLATIFYSLTFESSFSSPPTAHRFTVEVFDLASPIRMSTLFIQHTHINTYKKLPLLLTKVVYCSLHSRRHLIFL
jgi:hypothetical protein